MDQQQTGAGGVVGDPQEDKEGSEQLGASYRAAPGPGSGHSCGSVPKALAILSH